MQTALQEMGNQDRVRSRPRKSVVIEGRVRNQTLTAVITLMLPVFVTVGARAQTAHFGGVQSTVGTGLSSPQGVAVDASGNVYIADTGNNRLLKETLSNGSYTQTVVATAVGGPTAVAVDPSGNLYAAIRNPVSLQKFTLSGNTYTASTISEAFGNLGGIVVDASGTIYASDEDKNQIDRFVPSAGSYIQSVAVNGGLNGPVGITIDASGDLYIADGGNNRIVKATPSSGSYTLAGVASGLNEPLGVAVDATGDLFIADTANGRLVELAAGSTSLTVLASNGGSPEGVAVDTSGNLYIAYFQDQQVIRQSPIAYFGSVPVESTSSAQTLAFVFDTASSLNGSAPVQALTMGQGGLDYANSGAGTCSNTASYAAGATCTVTLTFTPKYAGTRNGAVVLNSSAGAAIATGYVSGNGNGPQIAFSPVQSSLGSGLNFPSGVAVDGAGNVYIADYESHRVLKETLSGGVYTQTSIGSGFSGPSAVAVDGAGNVYVADPFNNRVLEEALSGGAYTQTSIGSGLSGPFSVAVDGTGNVYIADSRNNRVLKETLSGVVYTQSAIGSGFNDPLGVAVDGAGNVYVADNVNNRVLEEALSGGAYSQASIGSGLSGPFSVAVDGTGNVYIADSNDNRILKETLSAGVYTQSAIGSGFNDPLGVAVDGAGNVYVADTYDNRVLAETFNAPPALSFASTGYGTTSADSPRVVTITNNGNQPLVFAAPPSGTNPGTATDFPFDSSTSCLFATTSGSVSLVAGSTCVLAYDFTPIALGDFKVTSSLVTNNLNQTGFASHIALSGTATQASQIITFPALPPGFVYASGEQVSLAATASSGLTVSYTYSGPATRSGNTLTITGPGTVSVTAAQSGNADYAAAASIIQTFTVTASPPAAGYSIPDTDIGSTSSGLTVTLEFLAAGTLSSIQAVTQGNVGLDFNATTGGTCATATAYAAGELCTVDVTFSPTLPGARYGAVLLADANNNVLGTAYLQGNGLGPQIAFSPVQSSIGSGLSEPGGVAVDGAGNVYIADTGNSRVVKETLSGSTYTQSLSNGSFLQPLGVAVDGAGNGYIADARSFGVQKVNISGADYNQSSIGSDLSPPKGVSVDGAGNVYIADTDNNRVVKETLSGGTYTQTLIGSGLAQPGGVAVDGAGNVYIADTGNNRVLKETLSGGTYTQTSIGSGLAQPGGVAVDGVGNVYIADTYNDRVLKEALLFGAYYSQSSVIGGFAQPGGVAADGAGNVYIADTANNRVVKDAVTAPPTLSFPSTATGVTSAPIATTITNTGNQPLAFPVPAGGDTNTAANFVLEINGDTTCPVVTGDGSLPTNITCTVSYVFAPTTVGALSGSSVLTDNNLNVTGSTQSITLTGSATQGMQTAQTISFPQPAGATYPGSANLAATATSGLPVVYTVVSGPATVSGSTLTYNAPGTVIVTASQPGNVQVGAAPSVSITINVTQALATIDWQPSKLKIYTGTALDAGVLDATDSIPASIVYSASLLPSGAPSAVNAATMLVQGSYGLTATVTPNDPVRFATTSVTLLFTVQNMNVFIANQQGTGSVTTLYNSGVPAASATSGGGIGASVDSAGNVWSINANGNGVSKFTDLGAFSASYAGGGIAGATALAIDGASTIWVANSAGSISALSNSGTPLSTTPIAANANLSAPASLTVDSAGSLWIANSGNNTVTEVIGVAAPATTPIVNAVNNNSPGARP